MRLSIGEPNIMYAGFAIYVETPPMSTHKSPLREVQNSISSSLVTPAKAGVQYGER